jgi:hypothetical protein
MDSNHGVGNTRMPSTLAPQVDYAFYRGIDFNFILAAVGAFRRNTDRL